MRNIPTSNIQLEIFDQLFLDVLLMKIRSKIFILPQLKNANPKNNSKKN